MQLDLVLYDWTTITKTIFIVAVVSLVAAILCATLHRPKTTMHHHIVNTFFFMSFGGILLTVGIGVLLAVPQQDHMLIVDETSVYYDGTERDFMNDLVSPDIAHQHIFLKDGKEYAYDNCVLLLDTLHDESASFVAKCLDDEQSITIFDHSSTS